jgi:hypothetical protein
MVWRAMNKALFVVFLMLCGCSLSSDDQGIKVFTVESDLTKGRDDWEGDFTGYPASWEDSVEYELKCVYTDVPDNVGPFKGLMISGNNHGDALFMFIKNKVTGLAPNTDYALVFGVELSCNASTGSESPKNVFLKVGASTEEPKKIKAGEDCVFNLDKGSEPGLSGSDMMVLGDLAASTQEYALIKRNSSNHTTPFIVRTNANGELWLVIGTESAYQGETIVYYTGVEVILTVPD